MYSYLEQTSKCIEDKELERIIDLEQGVNFISLEFSFPF